MVIPEIKKCTNCTGLNETITHTAVEDAILVIKLIRKYYS